jgi:hypothetical protein
MMVPLHMRSRGYRHPAVERRSSRTLDLCGQSLDTVVHITVFPHELGNFLDSMKHSRVVAAADAIAYLGKAGVGEFAREVHG